MRGSVAGNGVNLRRRTIRRRVIALGVAGVTIASAQIGVSMLGDTGTVEAQVTQQTNVTKHIYAANPLPTAVAAGWAQAVAMSTAGDATLATTPTRVGWAAAPSTTGSVATAGDVAVIDATAESLPTGAKGLAVTMYISNLAGFAKNYTSFALSVGVYNWNGTTWVPLNDNTEFYSAAAPYPGKNALFISDTDGSVTLNLPARPRAVTNGKTGYYEIVIDKANGFWQSAGTLLDTDLGPSFYLTATVY